MPRNGQGVYSKPAGTTAVPNTTIESAKFNTVIDDLVQDANAARPVTAGGTGSATPEGARSGLSVPGLSDVNAFTKIQKLAKGADVASATALTLGDDGNYFDVTGAAAITAIAAKGVGTVVRLHFDAALTLTHHATDLILPGGANITTAAGDEAEFVEFAAGDWRCVSYQRASTSPVQWDSAQNSLTVGGGGTQGIIRPNAWEYVDDVDSDTPVAAAVFTNLGALRRVKINGSLVPALSEFPRLQLSDSNGATWYSGATQYATQVSLAQGTNFSASSQTEGAFRIGPADLSTGNRMSFEIVLDDFNTSVVGVSMRCNFKAVRAGISSGETTGQFGITSPMNALRILMATNNIAAITAVVEGSRV